MKKAFKSFNTFKGLATAYLIFAGVLFSIGIALLSISTSSSAGIQSVLDQMVGLSLLLAITIAIWIATVVAIFTFPIPPEWGDLKKDQKKCGLLAIFLPPIGIIMFWAKAKKHVSRDYVVARSGPNSFVHEKSHQAVYPYAKGVRGDFGTKTCERCGKRSQTVRPHPEWLVFECDDCRGENESQPSQSRPL